MSTDEEQLAFFAELTAPWAWWPKVPFDGMRLQQHLDTAEQDGAKMEPLEGLFRELCDEGNMYRTRDDTDLGDADLERTIGTINDVCETLIVRGQDVIGRKYMRVTDQIGENWGKMLEPGIVVSTVRAWLFERRAPLAARSIQCAWRCHKARSIVHLKRIDPKHLFNKDFRARRLRMTGTEATAGAMNAVPDDM